MLPPTFFDSLWNLRFRFGVLLAFITLSTGVIATLQMVTSVRKPLASGLTEEQLRGPKEIAEQFLSAETSDAERLALLREPFDPEQVREYFRTLGETSESEVPFIRAQGQFQMLDAGYHAYRIRFLSGRNRHLCVVEEPEGFKEGRLGLLRACREHVVDVPAERRGERS
ncbi:MAG: hypothetical protein O3C21_03370 [Verrucomicrobia bacterium]|nr:hypothetical protein [Verrucomicrobiota bacterium]